MKLFVIYIGGRTEIHCAVDEASLRATGIIYDSDDHKDLYDGDYF